MIDFNRKEPQSCLLALDTSTSNMTIALLHNGIAIAENETEAVRNHSVQLLPNVQELLRGAGLRPADLTAIAVGQGPGSYTGVRIGVTAAKTFAWSLGIPLYGVSSLEAMALSGLNAYRNGGVASGLIALDLLANRTTGNQLLSAGMGVDWSAGTCAVDGCEVPAASGAKTFWIVPLMDARRRQAFTALYEADAFPGSGKPLRALCPDGIRLMSAWTDDIIRLLDSEPDTDRIEVLFVGETELFANELSVFAERLSGRITMRSTSLRARDIGALALERMARADGQSDEIHSFVPNYTQLAEAEVNLLKAAKERK